MVNAIYATEVDGKPGVTVKLSGEFDVSGLNLLCKTLDDATNSGLPVFLDLSRVTFLDLRCTREMAIRSGRRGGRLKLGAASWQAAASFKACGYGTRISPEGKGSPYESLAVAS